MCEYLGYNVIKLERVRIMNVNVKGLALGEWRLLEENEITEIMTSIANSASDATIKTKPTESQKKATKKPSDNNARKANRAPSINKQKKPDRNNVENPKSRELRNKSSNAGGKKAGFSRSNPSSRKSK
jgi:23S rRNA pseudouridine2604 synthase